MGVVAWTLEVYQRDDGESPVEDFIEALPKEVRAKVRANLDWLQEVGNQAAAPISKPLGRGLFEVRVSVGRIEVRLLYAFFPGKRIVLLHGFQKKTRATPARDLQTARARMQELSAGNK
jgi:phage-related protein